MKSAKSLYGSLCCLDGVYNGGAVDAVVAVMKPKIWVAFRLDLFASFCMMWLGQDFVSRTRSVALDLLVWRMTSWI
jgi:hypothetical protein